MQLLDAILAMALTLAALATIVTIIMETGLRTARMRKKNLVEVMKLLNDHVKTRPLGLDNKSRWEFITEVIRNPARASAEDITKLVPEKNIDTLLNQLGRDKADNLSFPNWLKNIFCQARVFLRQLFRDSKRSGLYDKVSMEHVLRRLAEVDSVKKMSHSSSELLRAELNLLARKYEEYGSAVSASFKRHSQAWSIATGILFALLVNIDGLRIFEAYRADTKLARTVIGQQDQFEVRYQQAADRQERRLKAEEAVSRTRDEMDVAKQALNATLKERQQDFANAQKLQENQLSMDQIGQTAQQAQQQLAELISLGIPIGWSLYPVCPYGKGKEIWQQADSECRTIAQVDRKPCIDSNRILPSIFNTLVNDTGGFFKWLFSVILTGILIGLGAPFWFDVAKRLAQIRQGVREKASGEERMSANNANGDSDKRKQIVDNVLNDAKSESSEKPGRLAREVADAAITGIKQ